MSTFCCNANLALMALASETGKGQDIMRYVGAHTLLERSQLIDQGFSFGLLRALAQSTIKLRLKTRRYRMLIIDVRSATARGAKNKMNSYRATQRRSIYATKLLHAQYRASNTIVSYKMLKFSAAIAFL